MLKSENQGKVEIKKQRIMWISMNNSCKNKLNDAIYHPKKLTKQRSKDLDEEDKHEYEVQSITSYKQTPTTPLCSFKEMGIEDPSRKVIEKIFRDTLTNPTKKSSKISKVYRVKNSGEVVEKFEKYRSMVKQKAKQTEHKHPRSLVDGNELLCFYATCMTCQQNRRLDSVSGPCDHSNCNLCKTIRSSFDMKYDAKRFGIQLSMSGEALRDSISAVSTNSKRVVIICRIIAGRIRTTKDGSSEDDEYDSIRRTYRRFCLNSEHLIVKNPNAVLPCFVIVLN